MLQVHRRGDSHWTTLATVFSNGSGAYSATVRLERGGKLRATVAAGQIRSAIKIVDREAEADGVPARGGGVPAKLTPAAAASRLTLECRIGPGRWKRVASKRPSVAGVVSFARAGRARARSRRAHATGTRRTATPRRRAARSARPAELDAPRSRLVPRIDGSGSSPSSSSTVGATSSRLISSA